MKTNGYFLIVVAFLWLASSPPLLAQVNTRVALKNSNTIITSQIDKNPSDLISKHINQSQILRNAFDSPSNLAEFHPDSIIYYSGSNLNERETFFYDPNGNLTTYLKELRGDYGWLSSEMDAFTYDDYGHVITELKKSWVNFFWEKTYLLTYAYDNNGNMLSYLVKKWEYDQWNNYNYYVYSYNETNALISSLEQIWQNEEEKWVNSCLSTNHFDDRGNLDNSIRQIWSNEKWVNSSQNLNTYNLNGSLLTSLVQYWTDYNWVNSELYTCTYNADEKMLLKLMQYYDNETWINFMLNVNTFDFKGNYLTHCELLWDKGAWINYILVSRTFDESGNMLSELSQEWYDTWDNVNNSVYTYDENGNCTSTTWFIWNNNVWENTARVEYEYAEGIIRGTGYNWDGSGWVNGDAMLELKFNSGDSKQALCEWWGSMVEVYYTALYTGLPGTEDNSAQVSVYPNPAKDNLFIRFNDFEDRQARIDIYDLAGKLLESDVYETNPNGPEFRLGINNYTPGLYFIVIKSGNFELTKKFAVSN